MFYIDESGSMPKFRDTRFKNRFFVISFMHTENPRAIKNTYKRALQRLKRNYPDFFDNLPDPNECKGSQMLPFMKSYIIDKLLIATDIKFSHMVVFNTEIDQKFRENPGRSFNYLVKLIIENSSLSADDINELKLHIDNRNTAMTGLSELEGYLYNNLVLESNTVRDVKVTYHESCDNYNIQVADMIAHIIYQRFRYKTIQFPRYEEITHKVDNMHPFTYEYLYNKIHHRLILPFVFPPRDDLQREAAATFTL